MRTIDTDRRQSSRLIVLIIAAATMAAACDSTGPTARPSDAPPTTPAVGPTAPPTPGPTSPAATTAPALIPQPPPPAGLTVAPDSARVDLAMPVFTNPTSITNSLFPVSTQASVLLHGHVDGKPFRTEVTLLPYTETIEWAGQRVEVVVSQYNAFLDGQIEEIAFDLYAQADDGSVWYFGEDVFDFADGVIISTEGTWQAGRDGPAAMIMPGEPKVGDVYRTENVPAFVFEEVTVTDVGLTLDGPLGRIQGAIRVRELHADGSTEDKLFAPGYGEFETTGGGDLEALALGIPTDFLGGPVPTDLAAISDGALRAYEASSTGDWAAAGSAVDAITTARAGLATGIIPTPLEPLMVAAAKRLADAVAARKATGARNAAIAVARLAFDVELRYRSVAEIDLARADLWAAQILVHAAAGDAAAVSADVFALDYVRDRIVAAVTTAQATSLNTDIVALQVAVLDDDQDAAAQVARHLRGVIASIQPAS